VANQSPNAKALWPLAVAALVVFADRVTKIAIRHTFGFGDNLSIVDGLLRLVHTENPGAAFGILAEGNAVLRSIILVGVSGVVLLFVARALWNAGRDSLSPVNRTGLALILGGAAGNLYDRLVHGSVTDFIEVYYHSWSFPAFNVADSAITVGAVLLLFDVFRPGPSKNLGKRAGVVHE
jgi:signal peptidase II